MTAADFLAGGEVSREQRGFTAQEPYWRVERALGQRFRFVELANDSNSHMPDNVVHRLPLALNKRRRPLSGSRILLLTLGECRPAQRCRGASRSRPNRDHQGRGGSPLEQACLLNTEWLMASLRERCRCSAGAQEGCES